METLSQRAVGRMASLLFTGAGLVVLVLSLTGLEPQFNAAVVNVAGGLAVLAGLVCWFLPWQRWPRSRTLWILPFGLGLLSVKFAFGNFSVFTFAAYFVVAFVWIGVSHPRGTSLWLLPLGAVAYAVPVWMHARSSAAVVSGFELLAICALVGESLGWVSQQLRRVEALEAKRLWDMQGLLHAGDVLARLTEATRAAEVVSDLATQLLRAAGAMVFFPDDGASLVIGGAARWPDTEIGARLTEAEAPALFEAMRGTAPTVATQDMLPPNLPIRPVDGGTLLFVPLRGVSTVQGVLLADLARQAQAPDRFDTDMAMSFATQAGLMLERLHAVESLVSDTLRDELTGLGNRRSLNHALTRLEPGDAIVLMDLDRFKELNDTRGHAAGDEALRWFGAHLAKGLREGDAAIRYGGDEFLLLLRGVGDRSEAIVERLREGWLQGRPPVGFSAGIAVHAEGELPANTVARADQALYEDKKDNARGDQIEWVS